jgi:osmotically-inducible protein OsmY
MRTSGLLLFGLCVLSGCGQPGGPSTTGTPPAKDNTAINVRDRDPAAKTPIDQDENETDVTITAEIRKQILDQSELSVNGRNVKVMTSQGIVTLRGPVASEQERDSIEAIAHKVAGVAKVDNQLEITR